MPYAGIDDFDRTMMRTCALDDQIAGCANSAREDAKGAGRRAPCGEWFRRTASQATAEEVSECFADMADRQIRELLGRGTLGSLLGGCAGN